MYLIVRKYEKSRCAFGSRKHPVADVEILNSLAWTAAMDQIWKENKERDQGLLWQYFGSQSGVLKVYPGNISLPSVGI